MEKRKRITPQHGRQDAADDRQILASADGLARFQKGLVSPKKKQIKKCI